MKRLVSMIAVAWAVVLQSDIYDDTNRATWTIVSHALVGLSGITISYFVRLVITIIAVVVIVINSTAATHGTGATITIFVIVIVAKPAVINPAAVKLPTPAVVIFMGDVSPVVAGKLRLYVTV